MIEIYERLLSEILKLKGKLSQTEIEELFTTYIYDQLSDQEVLEIIKTDNIKSIELPAGLKHQAILIQTLITIKTLQESTSWSEFEQLYQKPQPETIDFNELINHILKQKPSN